MKKFYTLLMTIAVSIAAMAQTPSITVTFDEGAYTLTTDRYGSNLTASPTVVAKGISDFELKYMIYSGTAAIRGGNAVETNGEYVITETYLPHSRDLVLEAWAESENYVSEKASIEFRTGAEPTVAIVSAKAENITENSVDIVVVYQPVSIPDGLTYTIAATSYTGPDTEVVTTTELTTTLHVEGLDGGQIYTYNLMVMTTNGGYTYMASCPVIFETLAKSRIIELGEISYEQIPEGAKFKVGKMESIGFDDDDVIDVYFYLKDSDAEPQKATLVTDGEAKYYEYTFEGLKSYAPYTAYIFGGTGEFGTETFFKGDEYKEHFVSGAKEEDNSGVVSIDADGNGEARYYNLQGVEVKTPAAGNVYIKTDGNKINKVVVK